MSRPANILFWSNSGNFPAGANPWNGQPLALQPAGTYFQPDTKPDAEDFNYLFGNISSQAQALAVWSSLGPAMDWSAQLPSTSVATGGQTYENANWSPLNKQWLIAFPIFTGGTYKPQFSRSIGDWAQDPTAWINLALTGFSDTTAIDAMGVCEDSVTGQYWGSAIGNASGNFEIFLYTGSWTLKRTVSSVGGATYKIQQIYSNGRVIYILGGTLPVISSSADHGATWQDFGPTVNPSDWLLKSNGTIILAFPRKAQASNKFETSPDGLTWTERASFLGTHDVAAGLCWTGTVWLLATNNNSVSSAPTIWQSTDGINWSAVVSTLAATTAITDMEACGTLLVATLDDNIHPSAMLSIDGGVTWYLAAHDYSTVTAQRIKSSGSNFLTWSQSNNLRVSAPAGLASAAL